MCIMHDKVKHKMEITELTILIAFLAISGSYASVTSNYQCSGTVYAGETSYTSYTSDGVDTNLAFSYMVEDPDYEFDCCGKITAWDVSIANIGVLQFHVWRKKSKHEYVMIGENSVYFGSTGTQTFSITAVDQIVVNKGDFIGWHNEGQEMIQHQKAHFTSSTHATMFRRVNLGDLYTGDIYNWSNVEAYHDRRFAIRATYVVSDTPTVTVTTPVTIPDYIQTGATVTRITWSDTQTADNSSLVVYFQTGVSYLAMDFPSPLGTGTGYLTSLNEVRPRGKTLTYFVYDTCYESRTVSQVINVQQTEIIIDTLPATVTVNETSATSELLLHTVTCTEPTDQWYCKSTWSTAYPFILKAITTSSYGLYKVENAVLDFDNTPEYRGLSVECVENRVTDTNTVTSSIDVYINENQPPSFTNLDAYLVVNGNETHRGDVVYYINATDPEDDDLTFTATYTWQSGQFLVTKNGAVTVTNWLVPVGNLSFALRVTVTDSAGNTDLGYLEIFLNNTNYDVHILNTPSQTMRVAENTANYTFLYRFTHEDMDHDTQVYSLSFNDDKMTNYFDIDSDTGILRTRYVALDFENLGSVFTYTATVMVGDRRGSATATFLIEILNENEAPRFTKNHFAIEVDEAVDNTEIAAAGLFAADMVDEDSSEAVNAETHEYMLNCSTETHRFYTAPTTGQIVYKGPYDVDVSGTPTDVDCTITVIDKHGLSGSASLHIHIKNVNEVQPEFTQAVYQAYVATNTLIGKSLLTVSAIDHDNSDDDDNVITYSVDQSGGGVSLLINIDHNGVIYCAASLASYTAGATLGPIILQASNYAVASRTGTSTMSLVIPQSTTTVTTTTDRNLGFYEDNRNYMWLILSIVGIAVVLLALSLVLFRLCHLARIRPWCYACCMRGICCRPKPEGPRGFGDKGYDLASFGHKQTYADEEIDGWLKKDARKEARSWGKTPEPEDVDGWLKKVDNTPTYRMPFREDDYETAGGSDARYADQPLYEMFRIPDNIPAKASYDPASVGRWKKRSNQRPL